MTAFVCFNRCLYCGRRTPHEVCHLHPIGGRLGSAGQVVTARIHALPTVEAQQAAWGAHFDRAMDRAWRRWFNAEPEVCEDESCPQLARDWA